VTGSAGEDFVFVTGAPGSKWSAIAHAISYADGINNSDVTLSRKYAEVGAPMHFGNYFGPGMEFGNDFDRLEELSREEIERELRRPYSKPGGRLLLKSHLFSRHLGLLAEMFPGARFVLVHRDDDACLDWWLEAGGFDIVFPDYSWYRELDSMRAQIALDNEGIRRLAEERGVPLARRRSFKPLFEALGLSYSAERIAELASTEFERRYGLAQEGAPTEAELHAYARLADLSWA
jgi:Sulfotransferase family